MRTSPHLVRVVAAVGLATVAGAGVLGAQQGVRLAAEVRGAVVDLADADSLLAAGDSAAALGVLRRVVRDRRRDAAAWHRLAMLSWGMAGRQFRPRVVMGADNVRRVALADSAFRTAMILAPDSGRYALDAGRFALASGDFMRIAAEGFFERALAAARRTGDSLLVAEAADELGMVFWRRYESAADRVLGSPPMERETLYNPRRLYDYIHSFVYQLPTRTGHWAGELDYTKASELFVTALEHDPAVEPALRHAYMALVERERWEELRHVARRRLGAAPRDGRAWLAHGLASHRLNAYLEAAAAFDSAMTLLPREERARYTRLSRLLRGPARRGTRRQPAGTDSATYAAWPEAQREEFDRVYWTMADPLALTPENEYRLEFLARVTYAELRWTSDEFQLRGADTHRGDIHVRYGPPDDVLGFKLDHGPIVTVWTYERSGLAFVFGQAPAMGKAFYADPTIVHRMRERFPAKWDNVPITRRLHGIAAQSARFRAPDLADDSLDLVLVARVPVDSLVRGLDLQKVPVDVALRVYDARARVVARDSVREAVAVADGAAPRTMSWRIRLSAGAQAWRVEALQRDALRAARAVGPIPGVGAPGLALSDVLLTTSVAPKPGGAAERWSDFLVTPNVGTYARGEPIAFLWETYGLSRAADGASRYRVSVVLDRVRPEGARAVAVRVVSGLGQVAGLRARGRDRVSLAFERSAPAGPVAVDHLTLDVGDAPAGEWRLTIEVRDRVGQRTARTSRRLTIVR